MFIFQHSPYIVRAKNMPFLDNYHIDMLFQIAKMYTS